MVHGFYRPAAQCSGDWWWHEVQQNRVIVLVGDVTGHGAASAMLTASTAAHYRLLIRRDPDIELDTLLEDLNAEFVDVCQGAYNMTMSAVTIDVQTLNMRWFNAGSPAVLILSSTGKVLSLSSAGTALGNEPFSLGTREKRLEAGDRVFLYTDGLPEMVLPNGRQLGIRNLSKFLKATRGRPLEEAVQAMVDALDKARGDTPLDDDLTFVFVDIAGPSPDASTGEAVE